ncbi:MAG: Rieske (2Fe-2S) protein [Pseudomonadota bacterium]
MDRRRFIREILKTSLYFLGGIVLVYPILTFITFRKPTERTVIFSKDEQQSSGYYYKEGVYLLREGEDRLTLSARCPHLGCTLKYDPLSARFLCPCHGSAFDKKGRWISGPAKKDLQRLPFTIRKNGDMAVSLKI